MVTGWTRHGHAIPGVPGDPADRPASRVRCGGPALCRDCARDAWRQLGLEPGGGPVAQRTGGVWVARYNDRSGIRAFSGEVEALRHAIDNPGMEVVFVPFGADLFQHSEV